MPSQAHTRTHEGIAPSAATPKVEVAILGYPKSLSPPSLTEGEF